MMEEEFRALLMEPGPVAQHVTWGEHPQGEPLPAVVLNLVSNAEGYTMQGPDGLWEGRVQVDCYAMELAAVKALSRAITARLSGYRGGGFRLIRIASQTDSRDPGGDSVERPYRVRLDFLTAWRQQDG